MKVLPVTAFKYNGVSNVNAVGYYNKSVALNDRFEKAPTGVVNFGYAPWKLDIGYLKYANKITGSQAIEIFEKFKLGNYLDLDGGIKSYNNSQIRKENLAFLDKVVDYADKKQFVDYYKKLTGFPSLYNVANKIKDEFKKAVNISENQLVSQKHFFEKRYYQVLDMGYDGVSSVAKYKALPGSDLDKAFVIIKGAGAVNAYQYYQDKKIIDEFSKALWENTDQRILSYNHDKDSFPKVYTEFQIQSLVNNIDRHHGTAISRDVFPITVLEGILRTALEKGHPNDTYTKDYVEANQFLINLCKKYPKKGNWDLDIFEPSREDIFKFSFVAEAMKWGEHFKDYRNYWIDKSSMICQLNNSQIHALKNSNGYKAKYTKRESLEKDFDSWSVDRQFKFIKSMILNSCGETTDVFSEYFASNESGRFSKLMGAIGL